MDLTKSTGKRSSRMSGRHERAGRSSRSCLMQHAGIQYGQGAANSHQSPPFVHADISQTNGGNTTSSLRQFRKKDGLDKNPSTDLSNPSIGENNSHIARVPPHNHYPARPNDYYRYHHQYPDYNSPFKEPTAQVKYSEIAETPPQPIQHVDHIPSALQKHKEPHKEFMDMCNITQQAHMKQNYPDNLTRQQSYPPDAASVHHQYIHKEPQVHPTYKPESQYQQYPQLAKYNMPSQCRKYPPPPPENDFLAKLQRINPSMARSIMSDHHIRESQTTNYPSMEQNRMYTQNQRYYPTHLQNNPSYNYHMPQPYNYPSSCNYKHPDYSRANQMSGVQYPNPHSERSISPRNLHMPMNYSATPQKISPNYSQYNPPEYAQHYQHRRASLPQDYYQQTCRANPYMPTHQISPESNDNRASSGLRHFIENWAEEEGPAEIAPGYKDNIRIQHNDASNEQVFVINSSDIPQCLENVSLVPTENGQYIIKSGALDNSVVRIKETTENNGERTVNLQIVEATPKSDCMMAEATPIQDKSNEESPTVPYPENQATKDCDEEISTKIDQPEEEGESKVEEADPPAEDPSEMTEESSGEASVIVCNEVSVIKDMPLIEEDHERKTSPIEETETSIEEIATPEPPVDDKDDDIETNQGSEEAKLETEIPLDNQITTTTKRTQRIFSVDDIINNIGSQNNQTRRNSLQLTKIGDEEATEDKPEKSPPPPEEKQDEEPPEENSEEMEFANAISVEDDSVILEIGGALVQLNINHFNGTKVLSVLPLSESLVIDVNGNYQNCEEIDLIQEDEEEEEENLPTVQEVVDDISTSVCQSEIVIGEESVDNEVFIDLTVEQEKETKVVEEKKVVEIKKKERKTSVDDKKKEDDRRKSGSNKKAKESSKKAVPKEEEPKAVKKKAEEKPKDEETKIDKPSNVSTKAAKKLYVEASVKKPAKEKEPKNKTDDKSKPKIAKLEETVNKIKSLKEKSLKEEGKAKKPTLKDVMDKKAKVAKKVTFNLETEVREIAKEEEVDRKKLSWEEYNSRKRKSPPEGSDRKIMEDTVTSSEDFNDEVVEQVELSIENAMRKKSPPKMADNSWEDDVESPKMAEKSEVVPKVNRCIIDVNEFNIKPIESTSTPSPVSSSQFSYHSEDDSLQVYKDVVDSKLNSLNINIPKLTKPKPVDKFSVLLERFLNKSTLNCNELEKVKKIIEFKRKIEEKQLTYEVRGERDYKDLKLHIKKVPEKNRTRKRFRNLYTDDTSEESDSSRSEQGVGDYSVYQRNSQGVPKLIFKRKSGLPQPFVKLERSQAVELLAKKRKLY